MSMNRFMGLGKIRALVETYSRPAASFDPRGAWTHRYDIYIISYANLAAQGKVEISRTPLKDGARLEILTVRPTTEPNLKHYVQASMECADNPLSSPRRWTVSSKIAASETASPYLNSGMSKELRFDGRTVRVSVDGRVDKTVPVSAPYGCKFCMLDAVQRLPMGGTLPAFGMFDEYDQIRLGYSLSFRETAPVQLKREAPPLSLFTMTGTGQLPASYWRDATGRLLFFVSGLEVYVLSKENGVSIPFHGKPNAFRKSVALKKAEKS